MFGLPITRARIRLLDLFCLLLLLTMFLLLAVPAKADTTTIFLTDRSGQLPFPFGPPNRATGGPGVIDNMDIGNTTPKAGNFTTLKSTDGVTCATFYTIGAPAAATDTVFFVATRPYIVVYVSEVHAVAAGGASVLQVTKDSTTAAPGAGTDLLTNNTNTGFDLNATANTVQVGTLVAAATRTLAAGDRLAVDFAQAIQSSAGIAVTACMAPQ
jgi:hypothetical protein